MWAPGAWMASQGRSTWLGRGRLGRTTGQGLAFPVPREHWAKPSPWGQLEQLPAPMGREGSERLQGCPGLPLVSGDKVTRWVEEGPERELSLRAETSA